jgi:hypothetical protein
MASSVPSDQVDTHVLGWQVSVCDDYCIRASQSRLAKLGDEPDACPYSGAVRTGAESDARAVEHADYPWSGCWQCGTLAVAMTVSWMMTDLSLWYEILEAELEESFLDTYP